MDLFGETRCNPKNANKRKQLTWKEKLEIIHDLKNGLANCIVARERGLNHSTVSTIWKRRKSFLAKVRAELKYAENLKNVRIIFKCIIAFKIT